MRVKMNKIYIANILRYKIVENPNLVLDYKEGNLIKLRLRKDQIATIHLHQANAVVVEIDQDCYIDPKRLRTWNDYMNLFLNRNPEYYDGDEEGLIVMGSMPLEDGCLYVNSKSKRPFSRKKGSISIKKLIK